jgi:hypothetical protein
MTRGTGQVPLPSAAGQVLAVLQLRLSALRGRDRLRAAVGLGAFLGVVGSAPTVGMLLPRDRVSDFSSLTPTAWLVFAAGAALAAGTGTGGRQLLTRAQAVAFPMSPAADHLGAVLMAPLNLAWLMQAVGLLMLTAWELGPSPALPTALLLTLLWIVAATCTAQAVGWLVELARTHPAGLAALRLVLSATLLTATLVALTGHVLDALGTVPTSIVTDALRLTPWQNPAAWFLHAAGLLAGTAAAWWAGVRLLRAVYRRPALQQTRSESRSYPHRAPPRSELAAALRIDSASLTRSAPLRRGLAALVVIPAGVAAASGLPWPLVSLLPGLVASAAGLLFGVNAFALDGPGALWRETLPGRPRTYLLARFLVLSVTCLGGAVITVLASTVRASRPPTAAELVAVAGATVATSAAVVGRCARWSVRRPYAASLREARDQPAPPGAMAGYAARLAIGTTMLGIVFVWLADIGSIVATVLITAGVLLVILRRLVAVAREWEDPAVRSRVLTIVADA